MKKIILVLMFSLGLVSAANIDAVCGEDEDLKYHDSSNIAGVEFSIWKEVDNILNLMLSHHSKEFKIDNKESICAYMNVYDLSFLNTQLTQDDIEQFERYMAEKGKYEEYEKYKKFYTQILKFFTYYHNHIPSYKTQDISNIDGVGQVMQYQQEYKNNRITLYRYVYGKRQGNIMRDNSFDKFKEEVAKKTTCSETTANSKEELAECAKNKRILPTILKWAESNMKQKGGQK